MKLKDLNPKYAKVDEDTGFLSFDSPASSLPTARIRALPIVRSGVEKPEDWVGPVWNFDGDPYDWDNLSLTPSIWHLKGMGVGEWHGFITNGEIVNA